MPRRNRARKTHQYHRVTNPSEVPRSRRVKYELPDSLVVPTIKCGKKASYLTEEAAAGALRQVKAVRARQGASYSENRYYLHEYCGNYHLTGREEWKEHS